MVLDEPEADNVKPKPDSGFLRRRSSLLLIAGLVLAVVVAGVASWNWHQTREREALRSDALRAARSLAVQVTSYDYKEVDAYFDLLETVSTGDFADRYAKATEDLREILVTTESQVTSEVLGAGVTSIGEERAVVVLFVDQTVQNKTLTEPRTDRNRVELTLQKHGDDWLISGLDLR